MDPGPRHRRVNVPSPSGIFDRDVEWAELTRFAADSREGATLGVVSGRRRQGKTLLLYELARATGGFYFGATEATATESLRRLGAALGQFSGAPGPVDLPDWGSAVDALLALGRDRPVTVVIDEFPYLVRAARDLPSIIQHALTPGRPERTGSRTRLLLCGSALSFMGGLLAGPAPLRGRAGLELPVQPLDHRAAAAFWGIDDPGLAAEVFSIVGGTPAYRREYVQDDAPTGPDDFDDWVVRAVLNPARPLFREARYLLAEDPDLRTPRSTTRSWRRWRRGTRPGAASPVTSAGRRRTCISR
ncbi:AAA family ATPase [Micromonospora carbonacea]|uniref:AAA family ATPase n=1 Tax=Micromonospora carbonacea TaxID=47853 RepID=UPI000A3FB19D|nr:ATP-binding protein [Micromonospora carbonacea]